jgi:hypothetical protein
MGQERWLEFSTPEEYARCQEYLFSAPEIGVEGEYGCWFQWKPANVLEVAYTSGGRNSEFATSVSREIAKRFQLSRIGGDWIGWYDDTGGARGYSTWVEWMKSYDFRKDVKDFTFEEPEFWLEMETCVREIFESLDAGTREDDHEVIEVALVFDPSGKTIYWHDPPGRTAVSIPDSSLLWKVIWEHRKNLGGVAHTHPWVGEPHPSWEDRTTFVAIEDGLGRRLIWPIVTFSTIRYFRWVGPDRYNYGIIEPPSRVADSAELRRRSRRNGG